MSMKNRVYELAITDALEWLRDAEPDAVAQSLRNGQVGADEGLINAIGVEGALDYFRVSDSDLSEARGYYATAFRLTCALIHKNPRVVSVDVEEVADESPDITVVARADDGATYEFSASLEVCADGARGFAPCGSHVSDWADWDLVDHFGAPVARWLGLEVLSQARHHPDGARVLRLANRGDL